MSGQGAVEKMGTHFFSLSLRERVGVRGSDYSAADRRCCWTKAFSGRGQGLKTPFTPALSRRERE
jgi:hypothetical protein